MNRLKLIIMNNRYIKNIAVLGSGTLFAQAINLLTIPIVTRIYSPEQLGAYYLILTIVTMFAPVINGRYDMAIVYEKNDKDADSVAVASVLFGLVATILIGLGLFIFMHFNNTVFNGVEDLVYFSLPLLLINTFINVLISYNNRHNHYKLMASVSVLRSFTHALGQICLGFLKMGALGIILSQILSSLIGAGKQAKYAPRLKDLYQQISISDILNSLKWNRKQPLFSAPALLLNSMSFSLMTFYINGIYSIEDVGYYSLAYSILGLPITLVSMNVGRVFFARGSEDIRIKGNFYSLYKKTLLGLCFISIPTFILLMTFSETIFKIVFGADWEKAGMFVAILSPMFAVRLIASCLTLSFVIANKQKIELILQSIFFIETIIVLILGKYFNLSIEQFLINYSTVFFFTYLAWLIIMLRISKGE